MQDIVNAASTPGEGARIAGLLSALCIAGRKAGYLTNPYLAEVHWQAQGRDLPGAKTRVAGESNLWVDPPEIPSSDDVAGLGKALAAGKHGWRDELMMNTAAYSGLRWGELAALTADQVDSDGRVIAVDRKVVEVAGHRAPGQARRPGPGGAEGRRQPARPDVPLADGQILAVVELQPERPPAGLLEGRVARRGRKR
jgi:integrase